MCSSARGRLRADRAVRRRRAVRSEPATRNRPAPIVDRGYRDDRHAGLARTRVDGLRDRVCVHYLDVPDSAPHRPLAGADILRFAEGFPARCHHHPEGWIFLIVGHLVDAALALVLFSVTVVSFPLLLDRDVDFVTAMITSVRAVVASPGPMIGWAAVVVILMIVACLPAFIGLGVVLPVLGHATWHLDRRIVPADA